MIELRIRTRVKPTIDADASLAAGEDVHTEPTPEPTVAGEVAAHLLGLPSGFDPDPAERNKLARTEAGALKAWKAAGAEGTPPATPNLDEMNRVYAATGSAKAPKAPKASTGRATNARRAEANAARKALNGKRGPGEAINDEALAAHIATVKADHPESSMTDELEHAYWVRKLALSRARWVAAWEGPAQAAAPVTSAA